MYAIIKEGKLLKYSPNGIAKIEGTIRIEREDFSKSELLRLSFGATITDEGVVNDDAVERTSLDPEDPTNIITQTWAEYQATEEYLTLMKTEMLQTINSLQEKIDAEDKNITRWTKQKEIAEGNDEKVALANYSLEQIQIKIDEWDAEISAMLDVALATFGADGVKEFLFGTTE